MSERLSEGERKVLGDWWGRSGRPLAEVVEAILTARLADQAARLAAVEAEHKKPSSLLNEHELAGAYMRTRAALHPDPSETP